MQPARAEAVRSTTHRVTVIYDGSKLSFQDPSPIPLAEGDILILRFQGIPNHMIPGATFSRDGDDFVSPLGPFQEALQTAHLVILKGNSGLPGTFRCTALLSPKLRGEETPTSSNNELPIDNGLIPRPAKAKEIQVLVRKPTPSAPVEVAVDLDEVALFAPDSVVWSFVYGENVEAQDYEPLLYLNAAATEVPTGPFGPFESLSLARIFGEGSLAYRLITSGNNNFPGKYSFNVGVRTTREGTFREILSVVDPIIDNSGPPHG
jgi:hypothetical protein